MPPRRRIDLAPSEPVYYQKVVEDAFGGDFTVITRDVFDANTRRAVLDFIARTNRTRGAWERAKIVDESGKERDDKSRTSEAVGIDDPTLAATIRRDIALRVFGDIRLANAVCAGKDANLQIQRYPSPAGRFDLHHDSVVLVNDEPLDEEPVAGSRLLTAFVYLNDGVFRGGETEFPRAGRSITPRAFVAAAWPNYTKRDDGAYVPDARAVHRATTIESTTPGTTAYKYGMNVWFCQTPGIFQVEAGSRKRMLTLLRLLPHSDADSLLASALNYSVDLSKPLSRTAQILALDYYLPSTGLVVVGKTFGVARIILDDDMARIREQLSVHNSDKLRSVEETWDGEYTSVLRALFAPDKSPPRGRGPQDVPYAEAYLVRLLLAAGNEVDWLSVLTKAVTTGRVTLTNAALDYSLDTKRVVFATPEHAAIVLADLFKRASRTNVRRRLATYISVRISYDRRFASKIEVQGIDREVIRAVLL